jgi:hypothetical protein
MQILDLLISKWEAKFKGDYSKEYKTALLDCISDIKATMTGSLRPPNSLDDMCHFKKHKGKHWKEVIEQDPGYCEWCLGNITGFQFDETAHTYLVEIQRTIDYNAYNDLK